MPHYCSHTVSYTLYTILNIRWIFFRIESRMWCLFGHFWVIGFFSVSSTIPCLTCSYTHTRPLTHTACTHADIHMPCVIGRMPSSTDTSSVPCGLCHRRKRMINIPVKLDFQGLSRGLVLGPSSLMNFLSFHTSF